MTINIPNDVQLLMDILKMRGFESYVVGGCVRDSLFGVEPKDWDICTNATPEETKKIFMGNGAFTFRVIDTGLKHGTITIMLNNISYEITTYRIDGEYSDHRRPDQVSFTDDIVKDLARRDFTINAMAYNLDKGLIDPFGGKEDLRSRIIKCVGDPDSRFLEDGLRILRALRFAATYGFKIDKNTSLSLFENKNLLHFVAMERVNSELTKILLGRYGWEILKNYREIIFYPLSEEMRHRIKYIDSLFVWTDMTECVRCCNIKKIEFILTLVTNFICQSKVEVEQLLKLLKYDNSTTYHTLELWSGIRMPIWLSDDETFNVYTKKLLQNYELETLNGILYLRSIIRQQIKHTILEPLFFAEAQYELNNIISNNECYSLKQLELTGDDLIQIGFTEGKAIGECLNEVLNEVIYNRLPNVHSELLEYVQDIYIPKKDTEANE